MRVLVTGGAGLIGSHLVDELLAAGYDVTILDNLEPEVHPRGRPDWIPDGLRFLEGDVRDPDAVGKALEGCEGVFHLAAYGGFSPEFSRIADVNATGTARLLEGVRRSGAVRRVVTASSMAVYGEGWYRCAEHGPFQGLPRSVERLEQSNWEVPCPTCGADGAPHPIEESRPAVPSSTYAASKYFAERVTLDESRLGAFEGVALRYFLTFGTRQSVHNPYSGIASIFATRLLNGLPPIVYEDGRQTRDVNHVSDVARATRIAFEAPEAAGRVFNVARGESVEVAAFARALARQLGVAIEPETGRRFRPMDNRHMLGDATSLRALGWEPACGLDDGLAGYTEWVRSIGKVDERFAEAEHRLRGAGIVRSLGRAPD